MTRLIFAVLISATATYGQGYRLTANAIRVDRKVNIGASGSSKTT